MGLKVFTGLSSGLAEKNPQNAWNVIVTVVTKSVTNKKTGDNDESEKAVTFSERLLRPIIPLTPDHQQELIDSLITDKNFTKAKFTHTWIILATRTASLAFLVKPGGNLWLFCRYGKEIAASFLGRPLGSKLSRPLPARCKRTAENKADLPGEQPAVSSAR